MICVLLAEKFESNHSLNALERGIPRNRLGIARSGNIICNGT